VIPVAIPVAIPVPIPVPIETSRLVIRPFVPGDAERVTELFTDPTVMRYISLRGKTVPQLLEEYTRRYDERGYTFWALCEHDGTIVGDVGFGTYEESGDPELGYTLAPEAWGRGYATEAGRACVDALFAHLPHDRIVALVDVRNERSLRTAGRIGLRRVGEVEHPWHLHMLFEVLRP
jgi:[ribosomal protein S5]-alanine N-acetyltransferase